mgnify:CR=1 FL=1
MRQQFRLFIEDDGLEKLDSSKFLYDISLTLAPFLPLYNLQVHNDPNWTTETARALGWICLGEAAILLAIAAARITLP